MENKQEDAIPYEVLVGWRVDVECNFRCPYCYIPQNLRSDYELFGNLDTKKVIKSFNNLKKTLMINITGGEPFLHPNFIELCQGLTKKNYISMNTNLSNPKVFEFAEKINPKKVGPIFAALHITERRRLKLKEDFIKKVKLLKSKGFLVYVSQVMWPPILKELDNLYAEFEKEGIFIRSGEFVGTYCGKSYPESYTSEEIKKMRDYNQKTVEQEKKENLPKSTAKIINKRKMECRFKGNISFKGMPCSAGKDLISVKYNGEVNRCPSDNKTMGNLFNGKVKLLEKPETCNAEICGCYYNGLRYCSGEPRIVLKRSKEKKGILLKIKNLFLFNK